MCLSPAAKSMFALASLRLRARDFGPNTLRQWFSGGNRLVNKMCGAQTMGANDGQPEFVDTYEPMANVERPAAFLTKPYLAMNSQRN